jgi:Ca2+-binding EF-hand superfamily protein
MRTVLALTLGVLVAASLQAADQRRRVSFAELDRSGDGRISVTEASASATLNRAFSAVDRDRDDYISEQEFQSWIEAQADASPQQLVTPGEVGDDGRIEPPRIQRW